MAPSSVESARSGTTRMSEGSDSVGELEIQSSASAYMESASSAWSTTRLPAEGGEVGDEGEVIQRAGCGICVFKQEMGDKVGQDFGEEGFGDHDPAASAEVYQDGGDSDVENGSHAMAAGEETESAEEEEVISRVSKRRRTMASRHQIE